MGQIVFATVYLLTQYLVMQIYTMAGVNSVWPYVMLVMSRRLHSIYVLRMFNDGIAMLVLYGAVVMLIKERNKSAAVIYSFSVAVKMNTLLMLPAILTVLYANLGLKGLIQSAILMGGVQLALGIPFIASHPVSYLRCAFDFKREFLYKWTVNWRFVAREVFEKKLFGMFLLVGHIILLLAWAYRRLRHRLQRKNDCIAPTIRHFTAAEVFTLVAEANLIGIICARSLHYQFYAWYFHMLPFLLYRSRAWPLACVIVIIGIEWCWNVFPSTEASSALLLALNTLVFCASVLRK